MKKIFCIIGLMCLMIVGKGYTEETAVINPFKELVSWTFANSVGATFYYDLDECNYQPGAKWGLLTTEHQWLFAGLSAKISIENDPALGGFISFNLGKLLNEKVFDGNSPYLDHLEVGYYTMYDWEYDDWRDGIMLNVLKKEF